MKILKIEESNKLTFTDDNSNRNKSKNQIHDKRTDETIVKLKWQNFPSSLKNEMEELQKNISINQAKAEAILQISKLLNSAENYSENLKNKIMEIYENTKYENTYLLNNIKEDLFSGDLERALNSIKNETSKLSIELEENTKKTNSLLVKFQNISTFVKDVSKEQIETTIKLIKSNSSEVQKTLNINSQNITKLT